MEQRPVRVVEVLAGLLCLIIRQRREMAKGWISIWRRLRENHCWEFKPFSPGQAWVDLLLRTNHKDGTAFAPNRAPVKVGKGELLTSMYQLAEDWGWSRGRVERWLRYWKNETQIELVITPYYTLITILKWKEYQGDERLAGGTSDDTSGSTSDELVMSTNNNDNNDNNVKNIALDKPKPPRKQSKRERETFKKEDYTLVLTAYQKLKQVELQGEEFRPIQQAIKTMFMSSRTPYEIIALMEVFSRGSQEWMENWTINTVKTKLPEYISELRSKGKFEAIMAEVEGRWKNEH